MIMMCDGCVMCDVSYDDDDLRLTIVDDYSFIFPSG